MSLSVGPIKSQESALVFVQSLSDLESLRDTTARIFCATIGRDHRDAQHFLERWEECAKRARKDQVNDVRSVIWTAGDDIARVQVIHAGETQWRNSSPGEYFAQPPILFTFGVDDATSRKAEELDKKGLVRYMGPQDEGNRVNLRNYYKYGEGSVLLFTGPGDTSLYKTRAIHNGTVARLGGPNEEIFTKFVEKVTNSRNPINSVIFSKNAIDEPQSLEKFVNLGDSMQNYPEYFEVNGPSLIFRNP